MSDQVVPSLIKKLSIEDEEGKETIETVLEDIKVTNNIKVTFLLGAGVSAPSGIPTMCDLPYELHKAAKRRNEEKLVNLLEYCKEMEINNIEDILSAIYIINFIKGKKDLVLLLHFLLEKVVEGIEIKEMATTKWENSVENLLTKLCSHF